MRAIMSSPALQGADEASRRIEITAQMRKPLVVYVQPNGTRPGTVPFSEFADIARGHNDPMSQRFAASLRDRAEIRAGERIGARHGQHTRTRCSPDAWRKVVFVN